MKVIYNGKLVEIDGDEIDGKRIITSDNYGQYEDKKIKRKWNELEMKQKREFKIGNNKIDGGKDGVLWEERNIISDP